MIITIETTLIIMTQVMKIIMIISVINSKSNIESNSNNNISNSNDNIISNGNNNSIITK